MSSVGKVSEVWVFPVKSMAGARQAAASVVAGGLRADRSWAVVDDAGQPVTAEQEPRLREVGTRASEVSVALDVPGATPGVAVEAAADALSAFLGRPVRLEHREGTGFVDVAPVHVVSRTSIADAAEHALECDACDINNPRANLVLDLASGQGTERDWQGREVRVGDAVLRMVQHPDHCLGAYAEVVTPGRVAVGDDVRVD
jgi:hypothetical protein